MAIAMPVISRAGLRFLIVFSIIGATGFSQLVIGRGYFGFRVTSTGVFMRSTPGAAPTVVSGHGAIQPDLLSTLPSTLAIFGLRQHGVLVSEGSVLNSGSFTGGRVFAEVNSTTNTGISLVSTRLQPQIQPTQTVVSFYFTDVEGITVRTGTLTLEANQ